MSSNPVNERDTTSLLAPIPQRPRLLLVDDQPINIQVLHQVFAPDHQVFMATSGEQALVQCRAQNPDLVLLDVMMPGMDGYEVCARLKADEATRHIPVIFVTAQSDPREEERGLDLGAVDFISKPINAKIVRARVKTHITLKHQSDLLRQMAFIDGLTGVFNRRHFDERLDSEWRRAARNATPLSLILLDVDFFKRYNDQYGHQTGDDCLRRVAVCLKEAARRPADLVSRYGGEEFGLILPETDYEAAMLVAQELERRVRELGIEHATSEAAPVVTISLGVATRSGLVLGTREEFLALADQQLYLSKRTGRARASGAQMPVAAA